MRQNNPYLLPPFFLYSCPTDYTPSVPTPDIASSEETLTPPKDEQQQQQVVNGTGPQQLPPGPSVLEQQLAAAAFQLPPPPPPPPPPETVICIAHAFASLAEDYVKKPHVFRLRTKDGSEYLMQVK